MTVLPHSLGYLAIFVLVRNECNSVFNLLLNLQDSTAAFVYTGLAKPHHYAVYRKRFPKCIRGVYTAVLNRFETALKLV